MYLTRLIFEGLYINVLPYSAFSLSRNLNINMITRLYYLAVSKN